MAFHAIGAPAALSLASRAFGAQFAAASSDPGLEIADHVVRYLSPYRALVDVRRQRETVISSVPLSTAAGRPVDLRLLQVASGFAPQAPAVAVAIPSRLAAGVAVGSEGVRLVPVATDSTGADSSGVLVGGDWVFYGGVGPDMDVVVAPAVTGAEVFWMLRSRLSPESVSYRLEIPVGAVVRQRGGGVDVVRAGRVLAHVRFPVAYDAQGQSVALRESVSGSIVTIRVAHRHEDVAYPIAVDPATVQGSSMSGWTFTTYGVTPFTGSANCTSGCQLPGGAVEIDGPMNTMNSGNSSPHDTGAMNWSIANESDPEVIVQAEYDNVKFESAAIGTGGYAAYSGEIWQFCGPPAFGNPGGYYDWYGHSVGVASYLAQPQPVPWSYKPGVLTDAQGNQCVDNIQADIVSFSNTSGPTTGSTYHAVGAITLWIRQNGATKREMLGSANAAEPYVVRACAGRPVNCATGNQFETQTDISVPYHGLKLGLVRTYNSQAAVQASSPGAFGYGWSSLLDDHLVIDQANQVATVYQSDASQVPFNINSDGSFSAPGPWVQATLIKRLDGSYLYTLPDRRSIVFDANGRLVSEADRDGNQITASYDSSGRVSALSDGAGRSVTLARNADGTVSSATDPAGRKVAYSYSSGNLTGVTELDGGSWSFGYDGQHQLTSMTDPNAHTTTTGYDASNRVVSQTDALGRKRTWSYSQWGTGELETVITNPAGDVTDERFNHANEPVQITHAQGTSVAGTRTIAYNANSLPTSVTDENGHTTNYTYDSAGNRTSRTDPLGQKTSWTYDSQHDVTSITTPMGYQTTIAYDASGDPTSVSRTLRETGQTQTTSSGYDAYGDLTSVTDPLGRVWSYGYDSAGDRTSATSPLGHKTTYSYDTDGYLTSTVSANGNQPGANSAQYTTTYTNDPLGRPTDIADPLAHHTKLAYDPAGNLTDLTDRDGRHTQYAYDPDDELVKVTRGDGSTQKTGYDADGQMISQTDGNGHTTSYTRNAREQITTVTDPLNRSRQLSYDPAGNLTSLVDQQSRTTSYSYDNANRLTNIHYSSGQPGDRSYGYDADGNPTSVGSDQYAYDSLDRLTSNANGYSQVTRYTYDLANRVAAIAYPQGILGPWKYATGTVSRAYDAEGNLTAVSDWLSHTNTFSYDADANLTAQTLGDGSTATYGYDPNDQLTTINDSSPNGLSFTASYTRTPAELLASANESQNPSQTYAYDQVGRLKGATAQGLLTSSYGYDNADNLTGLPSTTGSASQSYDNANQLTTAIDGTTGVKQTFGYDPLGERTSQTNTSSGAQQTYGYDQAGELTTYTSAAQNAANQKAGTTYPTATYSYDATGQRLNRNNTVETYDRTSSLPLLLTDGRTSYIYRPGDLPLEQIQSNGNVHYYHHDQLGSTRALTDQSGKPTDTYNYDPYGNPQGTNLATASTTNPLLYAGQYTDSESGLQYDRTRFYDPASGQFLTHDPIEDLTREPYAYAGDSPTNYTDPLGLDATIGGADSTPGSDLYCGVELCDLTGSGSDLPDTGINIPPIDLPPGVDTPGSSNDVPPFGLPQLSTDCELTGGDTSVVGGLAEPGGNIVYGKKKPRGTPGPTPTGPKRPGRKGRIGRGQGGSGPKFPPRRPEGGRTPKGGYPPKPPPPDDEA